MEEIMISTFLCNAFVALVCVLLIIAAVGSIQALINEQHREKREQEREAREVEYHAQRMKDLLSRN